MFLPTKVFSFLGTISPYLSLSLSVRTSSEEDSAKLPELRDLDASLESGPSRGPLAMPTCNTVVDVEGVPACSGSIFIVEPTKMYHMVADAPKVLLWLEIALVFECLHVKVHVGDG